MSREVGEDVDVDLATAVGLCAIGDATLSEAAKAADVTRWELEESIEDAGLTEALGVDEEVDVAAEIDAVLDRES